MGRRGHITYEKTALNQRWGNLWKITIKDKKIWLREVK